MRVSMFNRVAAFKGLGGAVFVLWVAAPEGGSRRLVGDYLFAEPFMKTFG